MFEREKEMYPLIRYLLTSQTTRYLIRYKSRVFSENKKNYTQVSYKEVMEGRKEG